MQLLNLISRERLRRMVEKKQGQFLHVLPRPARHVPQLCAPSSSPFPSRGGGCRHPLVPQLHPALHNPCILGVVPPPHPTFSSKKKLNLLLAVALVKALNVPVLEHPLVVGAMICQAASGSYPRHHPRQEGEIRNPGSCSRG